MIAKDLQVLEIGLELFKMEQPLDGECDQLLDMVLRVVRLEMSKNCGMPAGEMLKQGSGGGEEVTVQ